MTAVTAVALLGGVAWADLSVKDASGATVVIKNFVCETTKLCNATVLINSAGTEIAPLTDTQLRATPVPTSVSGVATAANQSTTNTNLGAPGATTCATDTGSCSLNQLLQRIAERLTSILSNVQASIAAGANIIGKVGIDQTTQGTTNGVVHLAATVGGATQHAVVAANTNNSTSLKGSAGTVYAIQTGSIAASAPYYLKLYDKATAPTCGTDTPVGVFIVPPTNSGNNVSVVVGKAFTLGIGYCVVTGIANNDNTAVPAATVLVNIDYK